MIRYFQFVAAFLILLPAISIKAQNGLTGVTSNLPAQTTFGYPYDFDASPNTAPVNYNYVRDYTPLKPYTSIPSFDSTKAMLMLVNTTYSDGWGRPLINIFRNGTPNDIVTPLNYRTSDSTASYLPYADSFHLKFPKNVYTRQYDYYKDDVTGFDNIAYSVQVNSRGTASSTWGAAPGIELAGADRGSVAKADFNDSNEIMQLYQDLTYYLCYKYPNPYKPNTVAVVETENSNGEKVRLYVDKNRRLICKKVYAGNDIWLQTYYVYNDLGRLIFTVPPKAVKQFESSQCFTGIYVYCFGYEYDELGNLIAVHTPGRDSTHDASDKAVYNRFNDIVMTQTPNQKAQNKWSFTIYDKLGRERLSGIYTGSEDWTYWKGVAKGTTSPNTHTYPNSSTVPANQTLEYWIYNGFTGIYPDSLFGLTINEYFYYDGYDAAPANVHSFATGFSAYYQTGIGMEAPEPYLLAHGKLVASKTRILDNSATNNFTNTPWITSLYFYDEKSRLIQVQTHNPWDNWDTVTIQYNFVNQPVLNLASYHVWSGANKPYNRVFTRYTYSPTSANLIAVDQMLDGDNIWHSLATYEYDELGKVITKWLGGDANGCAEVQHYDYNIRNQLTGINKDYFHILGPTTKASYASSLGYDVGMQYDRYDGKLNGYIWEAAGGPTMVYGYRYDTAGRMNYADYYYESGGSWVKTLTDYTVSDLEYDENGNIMKMKQRGPGASSPVDMDKLYYTYSGNRLLKVVDSGVGSPTVVDFDNGSSGSGNDYIYDANGNMISDANKGIDSILYNHFDKPIRVKKGSDFIDNIYDAGGNLIQKRVEEGGNTTYYRYWGPLVLKDDSLDYILNEQGRSRWLKDSSKFRDDFFVSDHQGNVRTVVTKDVIEGVEIHGSFEVFYANIEEATFTYLGDLRDYSPTGTPIDMMSARLNGAEDDHRVGAALIAHVMAGDEVNVKAYGYYEDDDSTALNTYATGEAMVTALADAFTGGSSYVGEGGIAITSQNIEDLLSVGNMGMYESLKANATDPAYPRTYLNYLVFDENMNILEGDCQVVQLKGATSTWLGLELNGSVTINTNGYVLIFFSGESDVDSWIDNIHFVTIKGRLLQTQDYYPHGLLAASSLQSGTPFTDYLFEGNRLQKEIRLELSDFNFRDYDQQIGRFTSVDPMADYGQSSWTPYHFTGNDPANYTDPLGLERKKRGIPCPTDKPKNLDRRGRGSGGGGSEGDGGGEWPDHDVPEAGSVGGSVGFGSSGGLGTSGSGGGAGSAGAWDPFMRRYVNEKNDNERRWSATPDFGSTGQSVTESMSTARKSGFWDTPIGRGVNEVSDWVNYNINPLYLAANGVYSIVTEKDLISGDPMSRADGAVSLGFALLPGGGLERSAANIIDRSIIKQAERLVLRNEGRYSVTLRTPTKQIRYDLMGDAHGGVPTPHIHIFNKHFVNGQLKRVSKASKHAQRMSQKDIRTIRKFLRTQRR